jgi:phage baseplate assembly protein W
MSNIPTPNMPPPEPDSSTFYVTANAVWPDLQAGNAVIAPAGNGMDRFTGQMNTGWAQVEQQMEILFSTPFHQRVLRRWVGSFVPHILGENAVARIITRFFWAIVTAIDLYVPDYRVSQIYIMGPALQNFSPSTTTQVDQLLRQGQVIFRTEGMYYPRAHLGDFTPYIQQAANLISNGRYFNVTPVTTPPVVISPAASAANTFTGT